MDAKVSIDRVSERERDDRVISNRFEIMNNKLRVFLSNASKMTR
jgi:hypothetical protein